MLERSRFFFVTAILSIPDWEKFLPVTQKEHKVESACEVLKKTQDA